ncbi:MAG: methylamine utilization protein MauJ [Candidatus Hodarchaeota archaeon]
MWIPYFILEFWEPDETEIETIQASEGDTEERTFEIVFFLENPPSHRQGVDLRLGEAQIQTQIDEMSRQVTVRFQPNTDGRLWSVVFIVSDTNPKSAFRYCYDRLSPLLSFWALMTGSGFAILGLRIIDTGHGAKWKVVPQHSRPEEFAIPASMTIGGEHGAMLSLYREARNSQSPFYRFLCCYKILEAWYRNRDIFSYADRIVRENNLPFRRPPRTVTHEMLVISMVFSRHPEFRDVRFGRFFELLNPWRRSVAHAITDEGEFLNFDRYESLIEIGPIANLTELVTRQVLLDESALLQDIANAGFLDELS